MPTIVSPYFFTWAYNNLSEQKYTSLMQAYKLCGLKAATLAFIISNGDATVSTDVDNMIDDVKAFIKTGGFITISFGGAAGTYIENSTNTDAIYNSIKGLLQRTGVRSIDFDVEGSQLADSGMNSRRATVLYKLSQTFTDLNIRITLPVMPYASQWDLGGLTDIGMNAIKAIVNANVKINTVNLMTMDYGRSYSSQGSDLAISCVEAVVKQLQTIPYFKNNTYTFIGICPMIGQNDDQGIFTTNDATRVSIYANQKNISLISYWGFQRDQSGKGGVNDFSNNQSSDLQFYKNFNSNLTSQPSNPTPTPIPAPTPIPIPVPTPTPVSTNLIGQKYKGLLFEQDPKPNFIKINGIMLGQSVKYSYKTINNVTDIGAQLDLSVNDSRAVVLNYNWTTKQFIVKTGFNLSDNSDSTLNNDWTTFLISNKISVPQPTPTPQPTPQPQPQPTPQPTPTPVLTCNGNCLCGGKPKPILQPNPIPVPLPQPMPTPVPLPQPTPTPVTLPQPTPTPEPTTGLSFSGISNDQIQSILQLTSIFENSTTTLQYDYAENINDGRGYTFGFVGFCSGTGDGSQMLSEFSRLIGGNDQDTTKYLKAMLAIDAQGQDMNPSLVGLDNFVNYVKKNGKRSEWIQANLNIANKLYVVPSQNKATQLGLSSPLSKGQLYDCYLNQGEDGAINLINKTGKVTNETTWLKSFLQNRYNLLAKDKTWAESVDRIKVYQNLLNINPTLKRPFNVTCYGDNYTLDA
jgi:hypothetical protein